MHEYSIVSSLIDMCQSHAQLHKASKVSKVCIAIGERSGVDSALIKTAFESFKSESPLCQEAELEIQYQPIRLHCQSCKYDFDAQNLVYSTCPKCQSQDVAIIQGRELHLLSLELDIES